MQPATQLAKLESLCSHCPCHPCSPDTTPTMLNVVRQGRKGAHKLAAALQLQCQRGIADAMREVGSDAKMPETLNKRKLYPLTIVYSPTCPCVCRPSLLQICSLHIHTHLLDATTYMCQVGTDSKGGGSATVVVVTRWCGCSEAMCHNPTGHLRIFATVVASGCNGSLPGLGKACLAAAEHPAKC